MIPVTKRKLADEFGVDDEIAAFFADRKPPVDNLFWKGKYVYLSNSLGYIIIPLLVDVQYRLGVEKSLLLNEKHVRLMEDGFDWMAKYEAKLIMYEAFIGRCKTLFEPAVVNQDFFHDLLSYLNSGNTAHYPLGSPVQALNRADAFFFTLCDTPMDDEVLRRIVKAWSYIKVNALILDDMNDLESDRLEGEENSIIELGDDEAAIGRLQAMFDENVKFLAAINARLAQYLDKGLAQLLRRFERKETES